LYDIVVEYIHLVQKTFKLIMHVQQVVFDIAAVLAEVTAVATG
jgi:hypothetical protein